MEDRVGENNEAGRERGKEGDGGGRRGGGWRGMMEKIFPSLCLLLRLGCRS